MAEISEITWHLVGRVAVTEFELGRRGNPYWKLIVETRSGFVCVFVRLEHLRLLVEGLRENDVVEVAGVVSPHKTLLQARKPVFLEAKEVLQR